MSEDAEFECPDCGTLFTEGTTKCPGCGTEFDWDEEEASGEASVDELLEDIEQDVAEPAPEGAEEIAPPAEPEEAAEEPPEEPVEEEEAAEEPEFPEDLPAPPAPKVKAGMFSILGLAFLGLTVVALIGTLVVANYDTWIQSAAEESMGDRQTMFVYLGIVGVIVCGGIAMFDMMRQRQA